MTGIPTLNSISTNAASFIGPNSITGVFNLGVGPNFFYIDNLALANNGLVYVILGDTTAWTRAPLISEIKTGSGPDGIPPAFFRVLSYKTTDASSANMAWTSLTNGNYMLYMVVSDDNPFDTAQFGPIYSWPLTPEVPSWEKWAVVSVLALLMLVML